MWSRGVRCVSGSISSQSEGGLNDIRQLDALLTGLGFTQKRADSEVRWAALNTVLLLRKHVAAHMALAAAMGARASVPACIAALEAELNLEELMQSEPASSPDNDNDDDA